MIIREDGTDGAAYDLYSDELTVGRETADANFPNDEFLGSVHAVFYYEGDNLKVRPLETLNGVFKRIVNETELKSVAFRSSKAMPSAGVSWDGSDR